MEFNFSNEEDEFWASSSEDRAKYNALCLSVGRNDPSCTEIRDIVVPPGYGGRMSDALQGNTNVSILYIQPCMWLKRDLPNIEATAEDRSVALLLQYLRESKSLREVHLCGPTFFELQSPSAPFGIHLSDLVIRAVTTNSRILHFSLGEKIDTSPLAVSNMIAATTSLATLSLPVRHIYEWPPLRDPLADSFGMNQSLQDLTLDYYSFQFDAVALILQRLEGHRNLQSLTLKGSFGLGRAGGVLFRPDVAALALCLKRSISIQFLYLHTFFFEADQVESLQNGLQSNTSLRHLSLSNCIFDAEATEAFIQWMQAPVIPSTRSVSLEKLSLLGLQAQIGRVAAMALIRPDVDPNTGSSPRSIGSSLKVLELDWIQGFHDVLATHAAQIRLYRLELKQLAFVDELIQCLRLFVYLKELELPTMVGVEPLRTNLVKALRTNGSLLNVTELRGNGSSIPFLPLGGSSSLRESYRYELRNQGISALLGEKIDAEQQQELATSKVIGGTNGEDGDAKGAVEVGDGKARVGDCLFVEQTFPTSFLIGMVAPQAAPHFVQKGLLALSQDR